MGVFTISVVPYDHCSIPPPLQSCPGLSLSIPNVIHYSLPGCLARPVQPPHSALAAHVYLPTISNLSICRYLCQKALHVGETGQLADCSLHDWRAAVQNHYAVYGSKTARRVQSETGCIRNWSILLYWPLHEPGDIMAIGKLIRQRLDHEMNFH